MILLIDNYDSFSYNLYQLVGELEPDIRVIRNDEMTIEEIEGLQPQGIILSPGPGRPSEAGICEQVVRRLGPGIPILGVCLGHQAICEAYGARITYAKRLMHGKQSTVRLLPGSRLFAGLGEETRVARYHSLAAKKSTLPSILKVTALTDEGEVMAVEHENYPVYGVQFHPESILTPEGKTMLKNFISTSKAKE
ncbi:MAG: aminodeoxychorismate/anthranilate synthase component II [Lachnospiraceae bacterium]|nr:aminodeoxychorismate/anthranilate synthase component II [Lachnospiraceae bacterium]MDY5700678.1 aminodeoxychorismate/anthranilate synthase component II [Lachnospiraceae bacterium]